MSTTNAQRGMTLIEIMISMAIMAVMMAMTWGTVSTAGRTQREVGRTQERHRELRVALERVATDFAGAYLSQNEEDAATDRRTLMIAKTASEVPEVRFSSLAHRVYWADANESDQTVVAYQALADHEHPSETNWIRSEQRRVSNKDPDEEPAEYDILVHNIEKVEIEFWDWKEEKWIETWNTTASDGQRGRLPLRVKVKVTVKDDNGEDFSLQTQTRVLLQEQLNFQTQ